MCSSCSSGSSGSVCLVLFHTIFHFPNTKHTFYLFLLAYSYDGFIFIFSGIQKSDAHKISSSIWHKLLPVSVFLLVFDS